MDTQKQMEHKLELLLKTNETVPPELNEKLLTRIQEKEKEYRISLWFLPMAANTVLWTAAGILFFLLFGSVFLWKPFFLLCLYMIVSGILLTAAACFYTDLKNLFQFTFRKRRKKLCHS